MTRRKPLSNLIYDSSQIAGIQSQYTPYTHRLCTAEQQTSNKKGDVREREETEEGTQAKRTIW